MNLLQLFLKSDILQHILCYADLHSLITLENILTDVNNEVLYSSYCKSLLSLHSGYENKSYFTIESWKYDLNFSPKFISQWSLYMCKDLSIYLPIIIDEQQKYFQSCNQPLLTISKLSLLKELMEKENKKEEDLQHPSQIESINISLDQIPVNKYDREDSNDWEPLLFDFINTLFNWTIHSLETEKLLRLRVLQINITLDNKILWIEPAPLLKKIRLACPNIEILDIGSLLSHPLDFFDFISKDSIWPKLTYLNVMNYCYSFAQIFESVSCYDVHDVFSRYSHDPELSSYFSTISIETWLNDDILIFIMDCVISNLTSNVFPSLNTLELCFQQISDTMNFFERLKMIWIQKIHLFPNANGINIDFPISSPVSPSSPTLISIPESTLENNPTFVGSQIKTLVFSEKPEFENSFLFDPDDPELLQPQWQESLENWRLKIFNLNSKYTIFTNPSLSSFTIFPFLHKIQFDSCDIPTPLFFLFINYHSPVPFTIEFKSCFNLDLINFNIFLERFFSPVRWNVKSILLDSLSLPSIFSTYRTNSNTFFPKYLFYQLSNRVHHNHKLNYLKMYLPSSSDLNEDPPKITKSVLNHIKNGDFIAVESIRFPLSWWYWIFKNDKNYILELFQHGLRNIEILFIDFEDVADINNVMETLKYLFQLSNVANLALRKIVIIFDIFYYQGFLCMKENLKQYFVSTNTSPYTSTPASSNSLSSPALSSSPILSSRNSNVGTPLLSPRSQDPSLSQLIHSSTTVHSHPGINLYFSFHNITSKII